MPAGINGLCSFLPSSFDLSEAVYAISRRLHVLRRPEGSGSDSVFHAMCYVDPTPHSADGVGSKIFVDFGLMGESDVRPCTDVSRFVGSDMVFGFGSPKFPMVTIPAESEDLNDSPAVTNVGYGINSLAELLVRAEA